MKNTIKSISVSVVVLALASVVIAKVYTNYSIQNNSQYYAGVVTMTEQSGGPVYVYVTGPGNFPANLTSNPTGVVINGYVTLPGTVGYAYFVAGGSNRKVSVDFTTPNIVIQDQSIIQ